MKIFGTTGLVALMMIGKIHVAALPRGFDQKSLVDNLRKNCKELNEKEVEKCIKAKLDELFGTDQKHHG